MSSKGNTSHKQILKTSGIIGGSQVITILISIVRSKVVAVLLGPVGVGLLGLFQSTIDLIKNATGFGLGFSAVRDVAAATGTNDQTAISQTILTLRRWVWATGFFGALITIIFSYPISKYFLKDESYTWPLVFLSITVLLSAISTGQLALLQGLRQIKKMAKANIYGSLLGLVVSLPLYFLFGVKGIIPTLIISAFVLLGVSWYQSNSIKLIPVTYSWKKSFYSGINMIKLGFFTVLSGLAGSGTLYIIRLFIARKSSIEYVGEFQAAWSFSMMYLIAVLNAMGADYYPRLTTVKDDNKAILKLVNEQTEMALLIAGPIIIATLSFTKIIVHALYSSKFENTILILQWQIAGDILKVIAWPIAFVILAKGNGKYYIFSEIMWNVIYLILVWAGWNVFNISITGIAFFVAYAFYILIVYFYAMTKSNFAWNLVNKKHISIYLGLVIGSMLNILFIHWELLRYSIGGLILVLAVIYSCNNLFKIFPLVSILNKIKQKLNR